MSRPQSYIDELIQSLLAGSGPQPPAPYMQSPQPTDALTQLMAPAPGEDMYGPTIPTPGVGMIPNIDMPSTAVRPPAPPTLSRDPDERMDVWRNLLSNFTFSLASGLSARAQNPRAGTGAALMAPFELEQRRILNRQRQQQINTAEASEQRQRISGEQMLASIRQKDAELPAKLQEIMARTGFTQARTTTEGARPGLLTAQTEAAQANTKRANFITTPNGLFDIEKGEVVAGTSGQFRVTVTESMAKELGLPMEIIGDEVPAQAINQLAAAGKKPQRIYQSSDGVMLLDEKTGTSRKIGDLPPRQAVGSFSRIVDDFGNLKGWFNPTTQRLVGAPIEGRATGFSEGQMTRTGALTDLSDDLSLVKHLYPKHKSVIGPGVGRAVGWTRSLMDYDPEIQDMFRTVDYMKQKLLYAHSGKVITDNEYARLAGLMPDPRSTLSRFESDLSGFERELNNLIKAGVPPANRPKATAPAPVAPAAPTGNINPAADKILVDGKLVPNPNKKVGPQ